MTHPRVASVVPVGRDSGLLAGCLEALRAQDRPIDDMIVIDDSLKGTLTPARGARIRRSGGRGPYAARNLGWRAAEADIVLFLDVRSRPRPGWARRLCQAFEDPAVALASSNVVIRGGESLGARAGERHQFFQREKYVERAFFRPYAPTCNLAVRRSDLEAVGGFEEVRSGGDADLCWRILRDEARRLDSIAEDLMDWVPRDRVRDYLGQNYRYGKSHHALRSAWADEGAVRSEPVAYGELVDRTLRITAQAARAALVRRDGREVVECLREGGRVAYQLGYRNAAGAERRAREL